MVFESLVEAAAAFLSAGGFVSVFVCFLLRRALEKARKDAERRKEERNRQELLRMEGEERIAALVLTLARFSRGKCSESELEAAEKDYALYTKKANELRRQIITESITT